MNKLFLSLIILATMTLTACQTMEGMGKDIQVLGEGMQNSSQKQQ